MAASRFYEASAAGRAATAPIGRVRAPRRAAHEQDRQDDDQRGRAGRVRDRRDQRPAEHHVAEPARELPRRDGDAAPGQRRAGSPLRASRQASSEQRRQHDGAPRRCAMWIAVSAGERQVAAVAAGAERRAGR